MKRQAGRQKNNSVPLAQNSIGKTSREMIGEKVGESQDQIRRYIRLNELIPQILDMVDNSVIRDKGNLQIAMRPAVELSYLPTEQQKILLEEMVTSDSTPSHDQAIKMRKSAENGKLEENVIHSIMQETKPNQVEHFRMPRERIDKFFAPDTPMQKIEDAIIRGLEMLRQRERSRSGEAR
jgi:ParB family chromosome partitioning protein